MSVTDAGSHRGESVARLVLNSGLARTEAASVAGRLGFCLSSSTALLFVSSRLGVAVAGLAVALFTVAAAVCAAPLCALYEERARPALLAGVLALKIAAAVLLVVGGRVPILCGVALAGASSPPTAAVMRAMWQQHSDAEDTSRLQALESVITQICVVAAPALVGILSSGPLPDLAPIAASCCSCVGGGLMWRWSRPHVTTAAPTPVAGVGTPAGRRLTSRLLGIFAVICASAMVSGCFNISTAARFSGHTGFPDTPGVVIASASVGSIGGGLLFTRLWRASGARWGYPVLMAAWALALWCLAFAHAGYLVLALAFLSGLPVTGVGAEEFGALGRAAGGRSAWLFGLANTAISVGVGTGAAIGAQLTRLLGSPGLLPALAATLVLITSAVLWPMLVGDSTQAEPL
ncbi:hypothetical protein [Streptomyces sp. NPDC005799]|uniref:hypothetical protein n=1 Tax=Streptomyces sp. NPDC005799 TaxID=3154678 RepID=UPI0033EF0291